MKKSKVIWDPGMKTFLENWVKERHFKPCPKVKNGDIVTFQYQFTGKYALANPKTFGKDNKGEPWVKNARYSIKQTVMMQPFPFFKKYLDEHGLDDPMILDKAQKEWLRMHDVVNEILQRQAYESANKKFAPKDGVQPDQFPKA